MASSRNFSPMSGPALSDEACKAVNAAFEALSNWRTDIVTNSGKNSDKVVEKMAAAAQALGWPEQIVEASRAQIQNITKMQIQMMDQIMDAWEEQMKSSNPSAALPRLSLPSVGSMSDWLKPDALQRAAANPLGFYMQFAAQYQKAWADAVGSWLKAGKP